MRTGYLFVILGAVIALVVWWRWPRSEHTPHPEGPARAAAASGARTADGPSTTEPPARPSDTQHVRRLTTDERRRLGEQIAAARERTRAAASATAPAAGAAPVADDNIPLEQAAKPLKQALEEAVQILAECYKQQPGGEAIRNATALMTMTSDPELGTVIDTSGIKDAGGQPLAAKLDECLRDTIDSLALPPLATGGKLQIQYTFKFD